MLARGLQGFRISGVGCFGLGSPLIDFPFLNFWSDSHGFTVGHVDFLCLDPWLHGRDDSGFLGTQRGGLNFLTARVCFLAGYLGAAGCLKLASGALAFGKHGG